MILLPFSLTSLQPITSIAEMISKLSSLGRSNTTICSVLSFGSMLMAVLIDTLLGEFCVDTINGLLKLGE